MIPFKKRSINLALQALALTSAIPGSEACIHHNFLVWEGWVQPYEGSRKYKLCINYSGVKDAKPHVWVVVPALYKLKNLPHVYNGGNLCLYWPEEWKWADWRMVAHTILPWACLWLYYYEILKKTGEWKGGGKHLTTEVEVPSELAKRFKMARRLPRPAPKIVCVRLEDLKLKMRGGS